MLMRFEFWIFQKLYLSKNGKSMISYNFLLELLSLKTFQILVLFNNTKSIISCHVQVFFFSIFLCSHINNHLEDELTNFGYTSQREIEIFKNPTIFLWHVANYYLHMAISTNFSLKSTTFGKKKEFKKSCVWVCALNLFLLPNDKISHKKCLDFSFIIILKLMIVCIF
jgi:hypothetical protein